MLLRLFLLVTILSSYKAIAQNAEARFVFFPSITLHKESGVVGGDRSSVKTDTRIAYINSTSWYFGMIYSHTKAGGANRSNQMAIGNSIGYSYGQALAIFSYYLMARATEDSGSALGPVQRDEGSGVQFDLAYSFPLFSRFSLTPMLSYRNITYKRATQNGVVSSQSNNQTFIYPYIGLMMSW